MIKNIRNIGIEKRLSHIYVRQPLYRYRSSFLIKDHL